MIRCKFEYKSLIKSKERNSKNHFSDELIDALMSKNVNNFWKCWKSKFKNKSRSQMINGHCETAQICNEFAKFFSSIYSADDEVHYENQKHILFNNLRTYKGDNTNLTLTVDDIDKAIRKLKMGKSAGMDGIMTEHLHYSHPLLIILLRNLFNAMLMYAYVPNNFTVGVIIPILKANDCDSTCVNNYRGVTISCILSKVLENCLLNFYGSYVSAAVWF